ncbi:BREX-2 system adenine-specific DNA-methyltransferase PglX [Alkalimarinus alittae]|uniref:site-specific DNA-methyltransferase (adenine-specific) n=1 Tax=Alkalimarinus alittae TaxID=2961619 RepID=A0ABY6N4J7_9ALTE|nr:BREX-2 system adenine-specific DNA-methyltransferase PglX [Alkalimarinus alittae]UZE96939.1 BREX-2 system adenine-specific DNA-methyltransferase PglX [Alkalimarinus alittae]
MINRSELLKDLQKELPKIEKDILAYSESRDEITSHLKEEYEKAKNAGRTADHFVAWREAQITQAAVAWVLTCVFVRFLEDNELLTEPVLSGPANNDHGAKPLDHAKERMVAYFNENPTHEERDYLLSLFDQLEKYPVIAELLDHRHNPLWQIPVSADGAKLLIDFFQKIDADSGNTIHDFTDPEWDTRFLGDLYQDLSESVRKRYALLQTPEFVESFILDYTLEKAKDTFGLPGLRLIDPTCGSGHFLLTSFERVFDDWLKREPGTNSRELAQRALDVVHGVDINPYAIAICRFRLFIAAMKAAGSSKVIDAPNFHFNLACGDSLLHGRRWQTWGTQTDLIDEDPIKHVLEVEDKDKLQKILGQQYHVVVGNPPYIVVRDKALNQAYRDRYSTCHRQYSLGVPFTERFFDLAIDSSFDNRAGYVGMITANGFMKREFGKKLIESFLSKILVTHIIDTSGAFIPGHGTPTVILFGRNQTVDDIVKLRVVMGVKAEPITPTRPEDGKVWQSIITHLQSDGGGEEYTTVVDKDRSDYKKHPWSLTGGGASELKQKIDLCENLNLGDIVAEIGFGVVTREDDAFCISESVCRRYGLNPKFIKPIVEGEAVRDWSVVDPEYGIWPYDEETLSVTNDINVKKSLWPLKSRLSSRVAYGKTQLEHGKSWYEYSMFFSRRYRASYLIVFPEVASHNHFTLAKGGDKVFRQTAPIIRLEDSELVKCLRLLAYLNSSIACFYMKQVSHQKQLTGGDGVRIEFVSKVPYQFAGTALKKLPVANALFSGKFEKLVVKYAEEMESCARYISVNFAAKSLEQALLNDGDIEENLNRFLTKKKALLSKMILLQEEIDWITYSAFGLCETLLIGDPEKWEKVDVEVGQRPFEIVEQQNQDGFDVPMGVPSHWPEDMQEKWKQRIDCIKSNRDVRIVEDPNYKRRWIGRQGLFNKSAKPDNIQRACKKWLLERIEHQSLNNEERLCTCASLSDRLNKDSDFIKIAGHYSGESDFDSQLLVNKLVHEDSIPQFSAGRYKAKAMPKFRAWQETWDKQRQEDAIDAEFGVDNPLSEQDAEYPEKVAAYETARKQANQKKAEVVGDIPLPPKYAAGDFRKASYWPLRGKLDVPKERFFSLPGCEKDGDSTLVIGWAGMNHLQRAQAIASWYLDRKETDGWEVERLKPMLVALDELIPWLKQWHNDIDPEFGERMGDHYEGFLLEELRMLDISREELLTWEPPAAPKKKRATKARKAKPKAEN